MSRTGPPGVRPGQDAIRARRRRHAALNVRSVSGDSATTAMGERCRLSNECSDHESPRERSPIGCAVAVDDRVTRHDDVPEAHGHVLGLHHLSRVGGGEISALGRSGRARSRAARRRGRAAQDVGVDDGRVDLGAHVGDRGLQWSRTELRGWPSPCPT